MKWNEQRIEIQKCGVALSRMNAESRDIPMAVYTAMRERFSADEIAAIESFLWYVSDGLTGADYLSATEMDATVMGVDVPQTAQEWMDVIEEMKQ